LPGDPGGLKMSALATFQDEDEWMCVCLRISNIMMNYTLIKKNSVPLPYLLSSTPGFMEARGFYAPQLAKMSRI